MSSGFRRYEILLPLRFNDGTDVPDALVGETLTELRERFGEVSCEVEPVLRERFKQVDIWMTTYPVEVL